MKMLSLKGGACGVAMALSLAMPASAATSFEFWHAMGGALNDRVNELAEMFNKSQSDYQVVPVAKGSYDDVVNAMIAAYRAKQNPAIVQVNERGFLTMYNSNAVVPVADLMAENGYTVDWSNFIAPIATYYSKDGKMMAMPFNSSTPILWYNADHFKAAGFDAPGKTWQELETQLYAIKDKGVSACAMVLPGDYEWSMLENYSAVDDLPYATKQNGFGGLDAEFVFNTTLTKHITRLKKYVDDGIMEIAGQGINPGQLFISGECSTILASTAMHASVEAGAKFDWGATFMPYEEGVDPKNSVIGGAALWALKGRPAEEYKGVAAFFEFLSKPETQVWWHKATGYVPVTAAAYDAAKASGYYNEHPTREIAVEQLMRGTPSENSTGFRLGNSAQANIAIKEEIMGALLGQKPVQDALDAAVARGNEVLRKYESINGGKN